MSSPFRQLARDSVIYGASTVVQRLLTFLLTPLYTNVLAPAAFGDVAQLYSLMALATVLATAGFDQAFMRYWVEYHPRQSVLATAIAGAGVSAVAVCGLGVLAAPAIAQTMALSSSGGAALVVMAMGIVLFDALGTVPFAFLRMERRSVLFALVRLGIVVLNVALNVVLVAWGQWGVSGVMLAGLASSLVGMLIVLPVAASQIRWQWDRVLVATMLRFGLPTVPAALAAMVVQVADRPLLGWMSGATAVGIYNANYRLAIPMMLAVSVYETAWRPLYLHHAGDPRIAELLARALRYFLGVAVAIFAVVTVFVGDIVAIPVGRGHLIGSEYWEGLSVVPIVMAGYIALGLTTTMAASIQIGKRTGLLPLIHGLAAAVNIILNLVLIPPMGYIGAAWATFGAYGAGAIVTAVVARRILPVRYSWRSVAMAALLCGAIGWVGQLFPQRGMLEWKAGAVVLSWAAAAALAGLSPQQFLRLVQVFRRS